MTLKTQKHSDARDSDGYGYAINVKAHAIRFADGGSDHQREQAWESVCQDWWTGAKEIAQRHGFAGVYAMGRSGGWCAPYYESFGGRARYVHFTDAELAELGSQASADERDEAARFAAFTADIETIYKNAAGVYAGALEQIIADDEAEEREAADSLAERERIQRATLLELARVPGEAARECAAYWRAEWKLPA